MNVWNVKDLTHPPVNTYKAKNGDVDIKKLADILDASIKFFQNQYPLRKEAAYLSRCMYKLKLKLRSDKGFKAMEKLNKALCQYLKLDFQNELSRFCNLLPKNYESDTYLPTRNMLDYILVKLQGLSMLMCRIVDSSKVVAFFMENKVSIGHLWKVAFISFSISSRIWTIGKDVVKHCCELYDKLLPFTLQMKNSGAQWLPLNYMFPDNLIIWLGAEWLVEDKVAVKQEVEESVFNILCNSDDSIDIEFDSVDLGEVIERSEVDTNSVKIRKRGHVYKKDKTFKTQSELENIDFGEVIERPQEIIDDIGIQCNASKKHKKFKRKHKEICKNVSEKTKSIFSNQNDPLTVQNNIPYKSQTDETNIKLNSDKICKERHKKNSKEYVLKQIKNISSIDGLKDFMTLEEKCRGEGVKKGYFSNLDEMQWSMLQKLVKKCIKRANKNVTNSVKINIWLRKAKKFLVLNKS